MLLIHNIYRVHQDRQNAQQRMRDHREHLSPEQ